MTPARTILSCGLSRHGAGCQCHRRRDGLEAIAARAIGGDLKQERELASWVWSPYPHGASA